MLSSLGHKKLQSDRTMTKYTFNCISVSTYLSGKHTHLKKISAQCNSGSKLGKVYCKAVYCHPAYLTYMQSTSCKMLDVSKIGNNFARRNINNLRYADDTMLMAESDEELKSLLMKVKQESERAGLKVNIQKKKIMASVPITSRLYMGKQWKG